MRSDLEAPGIEVVTARDGRQLLTLALERAPEVIIASSSLGQMGGFAVSRELKMLADRPASPPAPKIGILIERRADAWLATWSRCDAWLVKPVTAAQVHDLFQELTEAAQPDTPAAQPAP